MASHSWIEDYLDYTKNQQSPTIYHYWVGISVIASVLNRKVWLDRGDEGITFYKAYPGQLYMLLIGKSASTKKTTAINIGQKLMRDAGITVTRGSGSPEGILKDLHDECSAKVKLVGTRLSMGGTDTVAVIIAPEASVLLGKQSYNESMIDILTDLYDAPDVFKRSLSNKKFVLKNVCVTMMLGATPENVGDSFPAKVHTFGFLGRLHSIYSDTPRSINPLTNIGKTAINTQKKMEAEQKYKSLVSRLEKMSTLSGEFDFTDIGRKWFNEWNDWYFSKPENNSAGWPQRRPDHLLRLAMILKASSSPDLILDEKVLETANRSLREIEKHFDKAYEEVGQSASSKDQERILNILMKGDISTRELFFAARKYFKDKEHMQSVLSMLQMSGEIEAFEKKRGDPNSQHWRRK